jgi:hypothetical protein
MAQKISKEEYEKQTTDYTKKALAELNEQLKNFSRKHSEDFDSTSVQEEDDNFSDEDYVPSNSKKRIIIETNTTEKNKKRTKNSSGEDLAAKIITNNENKLKDLKIRLKSEESKSHYLKLDLSNTKCELEVAKEKAEVSKKNFAEIIKVRLILMLYILLLNVFIFWVWLALPTVDKIIFTPFSSLSFYTGWLFKQHFYKFNKL